MINIDTAFLVNYMSEHVLFCKNILTNVAPPATLSGLSKDFYDFIKNNFGRIIIMNRIEMLDFIDDINSDYPIVYEAEKSINRIISRKGPQSSNYRSIKRDEINVILQNCNCSQLVTQDTLRVMKKKALDIIKNDFQKEAVFDAIKTLFNYDKFRSEKGAEFIEKSKVETCPYCNRAFIASYENGTVYTADIDHYFPRSKYPFFGLTLYNLIPSCAFCNERLKLAKDFLENEHLYPYGNDSADRIIFEVTDVKNPYMRTIDDFSIQLKPLNDADKPALASIKTFQLQELYKFHKQTVINLAHIKRINTQAMRKEIKELCNLNSEKEIDNYYSDLRFFAGKNGILSKFIKDISNDLDAKFGLEEIK